MLQRALSMAKSPSFSSSSCIPCPTVCSLSPMESQSLYPLFILLTLSCISLSFLFFSLFRRLKTPEENQQHPQSQTSISTLKLSLSKLSDKTLNAHLLNSTQLAQSILLELLPSSCDDPIDSGSYSGGSGRENEKERKGKKKKKRKKKKQSTASNMVDLQVGNGGEEREREMGLLNKEELVCLYPFTSSSSATQRKIKQQYDQLVRSHESKGLTLSQVGQFVNCLVDAKSELQHKSESIKRKFTITKALLVKADRSSFDRLRQQIYKLELEQKRLEEDAFVYNWLQHQLKLSPAYKKIVEVGARVEFKDKSHETTEDMDTEQNNISFEEFLAKEKKDVFWQKYGKAKSCSG